MKMLVVRNFFSTSHLYFFPADLTRSVYFHLLFHCQYFLYLVLVFVFKFNCILGNRYFCWSIRNVKFINETFYNIRCLVMFITAVCLLFLLKYKSVNHITFLCFFF